MDLTLLDTDILSEILKQKNPQVIQDASLYLGAYGQFAFSALTRYEVRRGLLEKGAHAQLQKFEVFCHRSLILPITDAILDQATALQDGRELATGDTSHFQWIPGLTLTDWRSP